MLSPTLAVEMAWMWSTSASVGRAASAELLLESSCTDEDEKCASEAAISSVSAVADGIGSASELGLGLSACRAGCWEVSLWSTGCRASRDDVSVLEVGGSGPSGYDGSVAELD